MITKKTQDRIIDIQSSLQKALQQMDAVDGKLLIVFKDNKFESIISIGDIQRAIIKGEELHQPLTVALRSNVKIASVDDKKEDIILLMKKYRMEFMPVINNNGEMVDVILWNEIISEADDDIEKFDNPVVIMAGGKGTRLKPLTNIIPKPLIPIGEKPIIQWIIDSFNKVGVKKFLLSVNYKKDMIQSYFNQIENKDYSIDYFEENEPLGTAGSLHLLKGRLNDTFFVTNCDILIRDNYSEILKYHRKSRNELTAVAAIKDFTIPYGTFDIQAGGIVSGLKEKPQFNFFINAGMYVLEPHLINEIPENKFFHITELIQKLIDQNRKVGVFPVSQGSWIDIGEWEEYNKAAIKLGFESFKL